VTWLDITPAPLEGLASALLRLGRSRRATWRPLELWAFSHLPRLRVPWPGIALTSASFEWLARALLRPGASRRLTRTPVELRPLARFSCRLGFPLEPAAGGPSVASNRLTLVV